MKSLETGYLEKLKYSSGILKSIKALGEYKGKEELYSKQSPDILGKLLENAVVESAECSNKIEGIIAPHNRIENIVRRGSKPRNRPEQEIAGYRDVLNLIHQSHGDMPLNENVILQFHAMLYRYTAVRAGFFKKMDNEIVDKHPDGTITVRFKPVIAFKTPEYMNQTVCLYNRYAEDETYEALITIPLFVFDFLCIHPFKDGNGRIARLLTLLLMYQAGHNVGKYISLERIIEQSRDSYYDSLAASSKGWHAGRHDIFPWIDYFHGILLAAYKEFESRVGVFKKISSKTEHVKDAIGRLIKPFSIIDIENACPNVSRDMIRKVLRELRDQGIISATSMGRGAKWVKK
ncbi:MAG: Fic family protein [bacterium]